MTHAQKSGRVLPDAIAIDQQQRLQAFDLQPGLRQKGLAVFALYGRKTQHTAFVVAQQKLHPTIAEQALRIKNNNHDVRCAVARLRWPR